MGTISHSGVTDDVVMKLWAAIALLGDARGCRDPAHFAELLSEAETLLGDVIAHVATSTLVEALASMRAKFH
jgi:hypothetical protein